MDIHLMKQELHQIVDVLTYVGIFLGIWFSFDFYKKPKGKRLDRFLLGILVIGVSVCSDVVITVLIQNLP